VPTSPTRTVLVIGGGGREHALAWSLARSAGVERVYVAPGNPGTEAEPGVENIAVAEHDAEGLVGFAKARNVGLAVVGPEGPLALGMVDHFRAAGLRVFGPTRAAARLETSKVWSREFMRRHAIPHPRFAVVEDLAAADAAVRALDGRCVVKADGLAAGKGVVVCDDIASATEACEAMLVGRTFGEAGARVLIEERIAGPELSVMAICDGKDHQMLAPAQDHKRLLEDDRGPNTGGMGSFAPAPIATMEVLEAARRQVIEPTLAGMAAEGAPFVGCLYCGLMLTDDGLKVIEFNARFGDPEAQVQLPLVASDLAALLAAAARGGVRDSPLTMAPDATAVCIVLAAAGYPSAPQRGAQVHGIAEAERREGVKVFHAGTRRNQGRLLASGGRVVGVVCVRDGLQAALAGAYSAIGPDGVHFEGMAYRTDIAFRALAR